MLSVTILTKNSEKYIKQCLSALQKFSEVIVLDNDSTDNTLEIAQKFSNVKIFQNKFIGFGPLKNLAAEKTVHDWILNIDSDEIMTGPLLDEIFKLKPEERIVYRLGRYNYYNKKWIKACGWHPDRVIRLYNKKMTSYNDYLVHESIGIKTGMEIKDLCHPLEHHPFQSVEEMTHKMHHYTNLFAQQYKNKKNVPLWLASIKTIYTFIKNYFFQKGFLYGYEGLAISFYNASGVFFKYLKLYELNRSNNSSPSRESSN
ncbi:MAG: glycosyltransferase family 2 protein [Deltaproteobacteria bacterium]|nr:glycosyltransferase family 2 protein [Deltaproteobacteria bacterium]